MHRESQADLLTDLAVPHGDDSSSALTTSNGSVMDNYRQAQLAAWRELRPSVDRAPLRAVVSLVNSLWDPRFNWHVIGLSISGIRCGLLVFLINPYYAKYNCLRCGVLLITLRPLVQFWVMLPQGVLGHSLCDEGSIVFMFR